MVSLILVYGIALKPISLFGGFSLKTFFPDISDLFTTLEEEKAEKRKQQKRQSDRKAYWKKAITNGYKPARYRKGEHKLSKQ